MSQGPRYPLRHNAYLREVGPRAVEIDRLSRGGIDVNEALGVDSPFEWEHEIATCGAREYPSCHRSESGSVVSQSELEAMTETVQIDILLADWTFVRGYMDIFDPASADAVATVSEQKAYHIQWMKSLR